MAYDLPTRREAGAALDTWRSHLAAPSPESLAAAEAWAKGPRLSELAETETLGCYGAESRRLNAEIHKLRTDSRKKAPAAAELALLRARVRELADQLAGMGQAGTQAALFAGDDLTAEERSELTAVAPLLAHLARRVRALLSPPDREGL